MTLIKDLPQELQNLVHNRQIEQGNDGTFDGELWEDTHGVNFDWNNSPEGYNFWCDIDDGKDMIGHPMYPNKTLSKMDMDNSLVNSGYYNEKEIKTSEEILIEVIVQRQGKLSAIIWKPTALRAMEIYAQKYKDILIKMDAEGRLTTPEQNILRTI